MPGIWIVVAVVVTVGWLLWRYLPVGTFHGQRVLLRDRWKLRRAMRVEKANKALRAVEKLPAKERLAALIQLHADFGEDWLAGDYVRGAIIASGQDDALPWIDRILAVKIFRGMTSSVIKACTSGDAQPHFRVQMFKKLLPLLDSRDASGSMGSVPAALLELDREWAVRILTSAEYYTPGHPLFTDLLRALNDAKVPLPVVESPPTEPPKDHKEAVIRLQMARAVALQDREEGARQMKLMMEPGTGVESMAAMELASLLGLPHPDALGGPGYRGGVENLTARERAVMLAYYAHYIAWRQEFMRLLDEEELHGASLREIVDALRETGATGCAGWIEKFISLLGPAATERDPEEQERQIDALGDEFRKRLNDLEMNGCSEVLGEREDGDLFLYCYMIEHEGDFERKPGGDLR